MASEAEVLKYARKLSQAIAAHAAAESRCVKAATEVENAHKDHDQWKAELANREAKFREVLGTGIEEKVEGEKNVDPDKPVEPEAKSKPVPGPALAPIPESAPAQAPVPIPELNPAYDLMTVEELHKLATEREIHGRGSMDKAGLVKALEKDDRKSKGR